MCEKKAESLNHILNNYGNKKLVFIPYQLWNWSINIFIIKYISFDQVIFLLGFLFHEYYLSGSLVNVEYSLCWLITHVKKKEKISCWILSVIMYFAIINQGYAFKKLDPLIRRILYLINKKKMYTYRYIYIYEFF